MPNGLHMLLSAKLLLIVVGKLLLVFARFGLRANMVLCDGEAHGIDIIQMHLLQLGVLLVLLEFLVPVGLVDFGGVHWELHHHVLPLAVQRGVVGLRTVPLRPKLLDPHEGPKATDGSDRADCRFVVSEHLLLTVFHELVPVLSPLLARGDATYFLLHDHVEVLLLLLRLLI